MRYRPATTPIPLLSPNCSAASREGATMVWVRRDRCEVTHRPDTRWETDLVKVSISLNITLEEGNRTHHVATTSPTEYRITYATPNTVTSTYNHRALSTRRPLHCTTDNAATAYARLRATRRYARLTTPQRRARGDKGCGHKQYTPALSPTREYNRKYPLDRGSGIQHIANRSAPDPVLYGMLCSTIT